MRVLWLRVVVYGCVLAIGLLVWQVRADRAPATQPSGKAVLQGNTLDASAGSVTLVVRDRAVQSIAFNAPARPCADLAAGPVYPVFTDQAQGFDRRGLRFSSRQHFEYPLDDGGWTPMQTVSVEGELSEDGSKASGTLTSSTTWWRNGVAGSSCRSSVVRWRAART